MPMEEIEMKNYQTLYCEIADLLFQKISISNSEIDIFITEQVQVEDQKTADRIVRHMLDSGLFIKVGDAFIRGSNTRNLP